MTAYSTEDGSEKWRFYADAPVRFAPAVSGGKLFFVSDDGYLYCLNASDGILLWKFRAAPADDLLIGNGRMISTWPARGAPVLFEDTVYFSAGIWPFAGIFIYAIDAESGNPVWINSGSGSLWTEQQHYAPSFAGIAPQGYLSADEKHLFVSGGRTVPACLDRKTGKLLYFNVSSRKFSKSDGAFHTVLSGYHFICGGIIFDSKDGEGECKVPEQSIFTEDKVFSASGGKLGVFSFPPRIYFFPGKDGKEEKKAELAEISNGGESRIKSLFVKSGSKIYGQLDDGSVAAIDASTGAIRWKYKIDGAEIFDAIVADSKLFVSTMDGRLLCFAETKNSPTAIKAEISPLASPSDEWQEKAERLLKISGYEGFAFIDGVYSGNLTRALLKKSSMHLVVYEEDRSKADALRREMDAAGLLGSRITVLNMSKKLPKYFANLASSENMGEKDSTRYIDILRPYGGAALSPASGKGTFRKGSLEGADSWTHQSKDASQCLCSADSGVKAPFGVLWFGGPSNDDVLPRHGHGPSPQVAGGRIFIEGTDMLRAMDVYTGRLLWQKEIPGIGIYFDNTDHHPGANEIGSNYVSLPDRIYAVMPDKILLLDSSDGSTIKELTPPALDGFEKAKWGFACVSGKVIVATAVPISVMLSRQILSLERRIASDFSPGRRRQL